MARLVSVLHYSENPLFCFVMAAFLAVDSFFFLSGFLLAYNILGTSEKLSSVFIIGMSFVKRLVRGTLPALFLMCCVFLTPLLVNGPSMADFNHDYLYEFFRDWLAVLLQYRNLLDDGKQFQGCMSSLWYLSADFQLFVICAILIQLLRRKENILMGILVSLGVISCLYSAWFISGTRMTPFVVPTTSDWRAVRDTMYRFYPRTTTHAVAFFVGVITNMLVRKYAHNKMSKHWEMSCWAFSMGCLAASVFGTYEWINGIDPGNLAKFGYAATQRLLWSLFLGWIVFACSTDRAYKINDFLSWKAFVPLSRLSFGVYLTHLVFYYMQYHSTREPIFFSHFVMLNRAGSALVWSFAVSFVLFLLVDAPLGKLEKIVFNRNKLNEHSTKSDAVKIEKF